MKSIKMIYLPSRDKTSNLAVSYKKRFYENTQNFQNFFLDFNKKYLLE